ncbi:hypothetical protein OU798_20195 [Prolixibacteraceae bacterium Z1-6]|uniref:Uncharacterized protein n=1 Tax=Draconibacterium aestuarii TaxID=2998507 RepID=A0A9X3J847_9BACT|nr:hypothetical protein [Prolixibacteraceae bacterium Z1-6]
MLKFRINITRELIIRMAMLVAVVGMAILLDNYFDNNPEEFDSITAESKKSASESEHVYLISQTTTVSLKTQVQKNTNRKLQVQMHDKFLQKYHQVRNYQVLQAEEQTQTAPIIQSYHYLVFQNYFYTQPDEDSLA